MANDNVKQIASADFPTRWGRFRIYGFRGNFGENGNQRTEEAVALVMGDIHSAPPLVRIHSQCLTGDVFGSLRCDCREQLEMALKMIAEAGAGILIYEQQEGRGIGFAVLGGVSRLLPNVAGELAGESSAASFTKPLVAPMVRATLRRAT